MRGSGCLVGGGVRTIETLGGFPRGHAISTLALRFNSGSLPVCFAPLQARSTRAIGPASYRNGPLAQVSHHGCTANSRARAPAPPEPHGRGSRGLLTDWPEQLPPPTYARCEGRT